MSDFFKSKSSLELSETFSLFLIVCSIDDAGDGTVDEVTVADVVDTGTGSTVGVGADNGGSFRSVVDELNADPDGFNDRVRASSEAIG